MPIDQTFDTDQDEEKLAADAVDDDDTGSGDVVVQPWNPSKIRITTKNFTLREVVEQIRLNEIDLSPDFQRDYVWKRRQRTRLIESVLLGIPLPAFYFNQEEDATYQVVDGVQRLSTISLFMNDGHTLDALDLEYLKDLDGLRYTSLDQASMRRFRSAQIVVHIIEPQTPDEVKYDIFGRVNTLGSPLSAQEIRHAMSRKRSRDFLRSLSELESFDRATARNFFRRDADNSALWVRDTGRMMNRELALRFCAFIDFSIEEYRQFSSLDAYLAEYTKRLDERSQIACDLSATELNQLYAKFDQAMTNAANVLGKYAFRRHPKYASKRGPINRAVFEAQSIALANYSDYQLSGKKDAVKNALLSLFDEDEYVRSITVGTGDPRRVAHRMERTKEAVVEALK
ncbi:hypothetical protein WJ78_14325 [Burkholderia ubonensis]|uniref:DUF262 domain-containing protein n=1 Tax=Burkholderia ubonensis TaxID=101571 RepID=UPI0005D9E911|nr:DUF262 domain-containing protein [Burkholderia ubonensis]AJX14392.1 hypothetical protein BW23_6162 [Burkholderia ubonensis MSMB22]KVO67406.1 hypothetical protein WJ78_14325 [Burkholderia ubonensis]KVP95720.1 hypothetical protein WJ97_15405 [Burkholderia ubonensis]KWK94733.1 hypothetical protein WM19_20290 [Burkholderia ubonensis]KWK96852.1 hypothetical protein WM20_18175 [Burkholderia ubonensis]